jgi:FkbM family methyltransferase
VSEPVLPLLPQQPSALERLLIWYARHFPLRAGKMRLVNSLWKSAAGPGSTHRLAHLIHGGFTMPCDLRGMLQRQFYFFGTYFVEEDILRCWVEEARGSSVIFDVGANLGIFSLAALAGSPRATVFAFEPTPEIATRLRENARINSLGSLEVIELGVSSASGEAALKRLGLGGKNNEGMNYISVDEGTPSGEVVKTTTLDEFCETHSVDRIDMLKIDIEGHEHEALRGAHALLAAGRIGTVFMELNWSRRAGGPCPATESIGALCEAGFVFAPPTLPLRWKPAGEWLRSLGNVVARRQAQPPP